jgi:hypothetical protein
MPLVVTSQKTHVLPILATNKMENPFFSMANQKTLVTKVVGNGNMHITAKNGVKIEKFAIELEQTKLNWVESQVRSCLVPFL